LKKEYNKLWVLGDSFTTPGYCVEPKDSFWGLTAQHLNVKQIMNCSWVGNSFGSVQHMLINQQLQFNWKHDFLIIGIPPLERLTVFDNYKDTRHNGHCIDPATWDNSLFQIDCHTGLDIIRGHDAQIMVIHQDRSWVETQTLNSIFLLTSWLDSVDANYVIVNLSKSLNEHCTWNPNAFVLPYVAEHSKCIVFRDTYYGVNFEKIKPVDFDQYSWSGHHGPAGNQNFFENSLLPTLKRNKFC